MGAPSLVGLLVVMVVVIALHAGEVEGGGKGVECGKGVKGGGCKGGGSEIKWRDPTRRRPKWETSGGAAGAGVPLDMGEARNDGVRSDEADERAESRRDERAPLVCFVRGEQFHRSGMKPFDVKSLPLEKCTHIVYSFLETDNTTGELMFRKRDGKDEKDILKELSNLKHHSKGKHLKVLFSYGAGAHTQSLMKQIHDEGKLQRMVDHIAWWLEKLDLDGVNFHLEGPGPPVCKRKEIITILKFIKTLRRKIENRKLIAAQLPACRRDHKCFLFMSEHMSRHLDYLFLMTFDYRLDDLSTTKITSGLYFYTDNKGPTTIESETCLGKWIDSGVRKYKIIPGLAVHGRSFTLANPAYNGVSAKLNKNHPLGNAASFTKTDGYMNYVETCQRANQMHWKREWAPYAATAYIYSRDQWVSYDDKGSAEVKVKWFRDHSLGGVFVWSLEDDDYEGICKKGERYPMLEVCWNFMKDYRPFQVTV
ncbi:endochitinase-like [Dermacentor andersoni]|uniref:endochitinase-like n=1 Tax=Dermacentor andersoni TaxID=34620 RepID=UPI002415B7C1|nr:endochitinase-like isoform X1 [Dermacentor andersoni]XP_054932717.1 endochitinase-like isoform X1 [Dermacentor andersoni]XP_054932718.1 endochitinase-like isoform X1 [Dermacentor andersoni]XP_054932719.1 endochitinase-like isoform X1 [Dermacentor andersoni]